MHFKIVHFEDFLKYTKAFLPYFFISLLIIETVYLLFQLHKYKKKETITNLLTGGISIVAQSILKIFFFTNIYPIVYSHRIFDIPLGWHQVFITLFLYTFLQWFIHMLEHKIRFFWCLHEVHHSATQMNVTTGLRTSIFDLVSLEMLYLLIPLFGFHYVFYFFFYSINKFWGTFIHLNEKLISNIPFLKFILVTPAGHHLHHARNIPYLDKNYGELVPWFDFIFKTYEKEKAEKIEYGTLKITTEIGFWEAQTHEFKALWQDIKSTNNYYHKLLYVFMPPGWKPGNFENTAYSLQKQYANQSK
jgi:sterol desaturase/sphingolipid hydroxylase (fatty acid hydroxylase superfamily)